jgi:DNA-binding response OmpR family regulator
MQPRILICDDERTLVRMLRQVLEIEMPDAVVDDAYSGEAALSQLANASYDLILADLRMPGLGGLELIKGVRYLDSDVPIILMTAYGSDDLEVKAAMAGSSYYLDKPFDIQDLLDAVRACLEGADDDGD